MDKYVNGWDEQLLLRGPYSPKTQNSAAPWRSECSNSTDAPPPPPRQTLTFADSFPSLGAFEGIACPPEVQGAVQAH